MLNATLVQTAQGRVGLRRRALQRKPAAGNIRAVTTNNIVNLNRKRNRPVRGFRYQGICGAVNVAFELVNERMGLDQLSAG